ERSKEIMRKTIDFFERKGKQRIKSDDQWCVWYDDFIQFLKDNRIFATLLTPSKYGDADCRWDTWRNCEMNEILAFYGLSYWYAWQVSILGLGPVWMSRNEEVKKKTARHLQYGRIFGFGLSEREHGADIYSTDMLLKPQTDGTYLAEGGKYYIGNANQAVVVSTFGKIAGTGEYVFFPVDSHHEKFELVRNVVASQMYVAQYNLHDYPIRESEILERGQEAWDASLNTVNVGKFNLGWATIGICTHSFYEAINHASHRVLFGKPVTEFSQVRQLFVDAYTRLVAMRLFALRAIDYFRSASAEDRRYLLYNPMVKMKVTMQGEEVINLLWDVIAAKGFEKDTYFEMATRHIRALPKLEGTAHVNMALIVKFMANYFFNPGEYPEIPRRNDVADDTFFWEQGAAKGLGKIRFHDYRPAYDACDLPNLGIYREQIRTLKAFLATATPTPEQQKDIDFLLILGELFTCVVYGQLILENAKILNVDKDLLDQIFDVMVRDFSKYALQIYHKPSSTEKQMDLCMKMIRKPAVDEGRYERVLKNHVYALKDAYEMNP
ncbi:MAG TPA: acyl-CoA dehydrogenase, partial [Syntrophales bacterium]|nr:acyl-CoA dehydrogenase [Syntrophales bacterium]